MRSISVAFYVISMARNVPSTMYNKKVQDQFAQAEKGNEEKSVTSRTVSIHVRPFNDGLCNVHGS
jgi:hypothetical protein